MKLNTRIRLPDGRVGTIRYNHLDGAGGVWGEHTFVEQGSSFNDYYPAPEFMLREKSVEDLLKNGGHLSTMECVGTEYDII